MKISRRRECNIDQRRNGEGGGGGSSCRREEEPWQWEKWVLRGKKKVCGAEQVVKIQFLI